MKEWSSKIVHFVSTCIPDISNIFDPNSRKLQAEAYKWKDHLSELKIWIIGVGQADSKHRLQVCNKNLLEG